MAGIDQVALILEFTARQSVKPSTTLLWIALTKLEREKAHWERAAGAFPFSAGDYEIQRYVCMSANSIRSLRDELVALGALRFEPAERNLKAARYEVQRLVRRDGDIVFSNCATSGQEKPKRNKGSEAVPCAIFAQATVTDAVAESDTVVVAARVSGEDYNAAAERYGIVAAQEARRKCEARGITSRNYFLTVAENYAAEHPQAGRGGGAGQERGGAEFEEYVSPFTAQMIREAKAERERKEGHG